MFYLFIFESIGTSELMLIGLVALIVFGPRKLPELARTLAKTMAEFRRSTDDFKKTWQQEIDLEGVKNSVMLSDLQTENTTENSISRSSASASPPDDEMYKTSLPEIREVDKAVFDKNLESEKTELTKQAEAVDKSVDKRDWL